MKRILVGLVVVLAAAAARGDLVCQHWAGKGTPAAYDNALAVTAGKTPVLRFDLSALPAGAKVHRARLFCFTDRGAQPNEPAQIYVIDKTGPDGPAWSGKPLTLLGPWYDSFDATEAVRTWAKAPKANLGLAAERFEKLQPARSYLEILFEGPAPQKLPEQVANVRVIHHDGQSFIVWREVAEYRPDPAQVVWVDRWDENGDKYAEGPGADQFGQGRVPAMKLVELRRLQGLGLRDQPSGFQGIKGLVRVAETAPVAYRVYRHTQPITKQNLPQAALLAEVDPLSGVDSEVYATHYKGEYLDQWEEPTSPMPMYCPEDGKPIAPGEGLYVHTSKEAGEFYYAVTTVWAGTENLAQIGEGNSLAAAVKEAPADPRPVLQFIQNDRYRNEKDVKEHWYRFWAAPPSYNLPGKSFRVAVGVGEKAPKPGALEIGSINGYFNVRGDLNLPPPNAVRLLIESQAAWMPELMYNEGRGTLRAVNQSKVDNFIERYMLYIINWARAKWPIDPTQITGSMLYFGLRHPELFARMSFGTYTANYDMRWCPGGPSLAGLLGPKGIKTVDGDDAWEMMSVGGWLKKHPDRDIPFLMCMSNVGKDSGHTSEFGWQDDPRGWKALMDARQTFVASWSTGFSGELGKGLDAMRWDVSIPAFSNGTLDNNPGNGEPADGDYYGTINGWLLWGDKDQVDQAGRWEMTVWVISSCARDDCTVDITPRHCKAFKAKPGEAFNWSNTPLGGPAASEGATTKPVQAGQVKADQHGLVTLKGMQVGKGRNRIALWR